MTALTTEQKAYIRDMSGDDCTPYYIDEPTTQWTYDQLGGDIDHTIAILLRRIVGKLAKQTDTEDAAGMENAHSQLYEHYRELLEDWMLTAGLDGGKLAAMLLDLNIDWDVSDVERLYDN